MLTGPEGTPIDTGRLGVRFAYHPGSPEHRDNSGMACAPCWDDVSAWMTTKSAGPTTCSVCGGDLRGGRLVVSRLGELEPRVLCHLHGVAFLNRLVTVEPKLDPATFSFPGGPRRGTGG